MSGSLASAIEARQNLTKFMVIICIAVALEGVVHILRAADEEISALLPPVLLVLMLRGPGGGARSVSEAEWARRGARAPRRAARRREDDQGKAVSLSIEKTLQSGWQILLA